MVVFLWVFRNKKIFSFMVFESTGTPPTLKPPHDANSRHTTKKYKSYKLLIYYTYTYLYSLLYYYYY